MTRILLFLLFFIMLAADTLGWNLSLAPGLSVKNAFLYLILVGIAFDAALRQNRHIELLPVIVPYALCFFYAAFTIVIIVLFLDYPRYEVITSLISLKSRLAENLLILLVFFFGVLTAKDALWLIKMMIWTVVIANLITVVDAVNLPDLGLIHQREDGRVSGPIGEANQYAAFLALFLPASIALVMLEQGTRRALAVLGAVASSLALLMTVSRGGFLGVLIGAAIGAVFLRQFISRKAAVSAIGAIAVLACAGVATLYFAGYGDLLYERTVGLTTQGTSSHITSGRTYIWGTTINKMFEQPVSLITGYGWDAYRQFRDFRYAPHNTYLNLYFELGVVGLVLVLLSFVNVLRTARVGFRKADSDAAAMLFAFIFGLLGILVAIFFVDIYSPWLFVWAYVGTAMRLAVMQKESTASRATENVRFATPVRAIKPS